MAVNNNFGDIKSWIARKSNKDLTQFETDIEEAIVAAIQCYEHIPVWFLEELGTLTVLEGDNNVELPEDFKKLVNARVLINGTWKTKKDGFKGRSFEEQQDADIIDGNTGEPQDWALFGNSFYVRPTADADYTISLAYARGDTAYPSSDGDQSLWFDDASVNVIRYKALAIFYRDRLHGYQQADKYDEFAAERMGKLVDRNNTREPIYELD